MLLGKVTRCTLPSIHLFYLLYWLSKRLADLTQNVTFVKFAKIRQMVLFVVLLQLLPVVSAMLCRVVTNFRN